MSAKHESRLIFAEISLALKTFGALFRSLEGTLIFRGTRWNGLENHRLYRTLLVQHAQVELLVVQKHLLHLRREVEAIVLQKELILKLQKLVILLHRHLVLTSEDEASVSVQSLQRADETR